MSAVDAAIFTANVLNIAPLEVWIAIGSMDTMMQIANGSHASVENNRG
jgi:hypothetical protein